MFVHRLSKFFVKEDTTSSSSEQGFGGCVHNDDLQYLDKLFYSGSQVDRRFLQMFKVMYSVDSKSFSMPSIHGTSSIAMPSRTKIEKPPHHQEISSSSEDFDASIEANAENGLTQYRKSNILSRNL